MSLRNRVRAWLGLDAIASEVHTAAERAYHAANRSLPPRELPAPFVAVLIEALGSNDCPVYMGKSRHLSEKESVLEFRSWQVLTDTRVIVFCDLARVEVRGVYKGTNLMQGDIGDCPMAYIDTWGPGILLRVMCTVRP